MERDIRTSLEAGFIDHLVKPVNPDTLHRIIARTLAPAPHRNFQTPGAVTNRCLPRYRWTGDG